MPFIHWKILSNPSPHVNIFHNWSENDGKGAAWKNYPSRPRKINEHSEYVKKMDK